MRTTLDLSAKIVRIINFNMNGRTNTAKPVVYYTMEYMSFGDLYELIENIGLISEAMALRFVKSVLKNLRQLHQKSIFHLDIKPENVLVGTEGEMVFCDFGHSINRKKFFSKFAHISFVGSVQYAAPEMNELTNLKRKKLKEKELKTILNKFNF